MEAIKKTNEDIASRLPPRKETGYEERCKPKGKEKVQGGHGEEESSIHINHHTATQSEKSSSNQRSHRIGMPTQQSNKEESSYRPSRHSRSHHSQTSKAEDRKIKVDQDVKDLKEKYNKMVFFMENGEGQSMAKHLMTKTTLPFTDRVMRFPLPDKFKDPRVDKYDGRVDPSDHVEGFRAHLELCGTPNEIACQAIPLTLKGVAKEWFSNLKPQSIDSFDMLGHQFQNQFLAIRRRKKNPAYLLSLV
jgi:hypothetical protein